MAAEVREMDKLDGGNLGVTCEIGTLNQPSNGNPSLLIVLLSGVCQPDSSSKQGPHVVSRVKQLHQVPVELN